MKKSISVDQMNYRYQILAEFKRRKSANVHYSLRSFSKLLELSPAFLSKLLNGQKDLSLDRAVSIAEKLGFNSEETRHFCQLIQLNKSRSAKTREALLRTNSADAADEFQNLSLEVFQVISDWYHYAILELAACYPTRLDSALVSKNLGISKNEAAEALERLLSLKLLEKVNGRWRKLKTFLATPSEVPSRALRNFHSQMIQKSLVAMEEQPVDLRDISGMTIPISLDKVSLAKKEIRQFRRKMAKLLDSSHATDVYQLNIQFFSLTKNIETQKEKKV